MKDATQIAVLPSAVGMDLATRVRWKIQGLRQLTTLVRLTRNWRAVWRHRRDKDRLPSFQLRDGLVLHHGPFDSPMHLLEEVFAERWYDVGVRPPAHATMLDIGANIGSVSLFWSTQSPTLRIHAYEPNPNAFTMLERNISGNRLESRVQVFAEAIGREAGTLHLWSDVPSELSTGYLEQSPHQGGRRISVATIGLDEAWRRAGLAPIWLLKIDTEGAEVDILEGASPQLLEAVQFAIVETHDHISPNALSRCQRVFEDAGFSCRIRRHPWDEAVIYAQKPRAGVPLEGPR